MPQTAGQQRSTTRQQTGAAAEALAAAFLQQQGLALLARNFRVRGGEIDLICEEGQTLVFVEVRLRQRQDFGGAAASITPRKQQRIILATRHYLARQQATNRDCRFDCLLLDRLDASAIVWLKGAFDAGGF